MRDFCTNCQTQTQLYVIDSDDTGLGISEDLYCEQCNLFVRSQPKESFGLLFSQIERELKSKPEARPPEDI